MLKRLLLILFAINFLAIEAFCVCPVSIATPMQSLEKQLTEGLAPLHEYVIFTHTPTGFAVSVKDELMFDECGELNDAGKLLLNVIATIMKQSGRKWLILCHTDKGATQIDRISKTSLKAGAITDYLTDQEKCLINQIFPIGFGSIMPIKSNKAIGKGLHNRVDFITEEFNLN